MSKRTREEEGLALALASPERLPIVRGPTNSQVALLGHPVSGRLTRNAKSIVRAHCNAAREIPWDHTASDSLGMNWGYRTWRYWSAGRLPLDPGGT